MIGDESEEIEPDTWSINLLTTLDDLPDILISQEIAPLSVSSCVETRTPNSPDDTTLPSSSPLSNPQSWKSAPKTVDQCEPRFIE
jgi:hypothetical protein